MKKKKKGKVLRAATQVQQAQPRPVGMRPGPVGRFEPAMALLDSGRREGRLKAWPGTSATATTDIVRDGGQTLKRCRDAIRNSPWGRKAVDAWSSAVIGVGIKPSPRLDNESVRTRLLDDWRDWTDEADADGRTDFYGLQRLAAREVFISGEVFFRRRWRRPEDGLVVPFQLQVISSEQLPTWLFGDYTAGAGGTPPNNTIKAGIEFDPIGRRAAYHFLRVHPGEHAYNPALFDQTNRDQFVRVPARDVVHVYDTEEPGQVRGMPRMAAGLVRLYEADRYMDAQLARQHTAACYGILVEPAVDGLVAVQPQPVEMTQPEQDGPLVADLPIYPNCMVTLGAGEKWTQLEPPQVLSEFDTFMYRVACDVASAFGIPYLALTGDAGKANFSSERASHVRWWREIEPVQHQTFVHQMCRPIWDWFIEAGVMAGTLRLPGMAGNPRQYRRLDWITHKWDWVDPLKDMQAHVLAMQHGVISREHIQDAWGADPAAEDASIAASQKRAKDLGLELVPAAPQAPGSQPAGDSADDNEDQPARRDEEDD